MLTKYRIAYTISNRLKVIHIEAASPMLAFKKFKEMMPEIMYKNLAVNEIEEEIILHPRRQNLKSCFNCELKFKKTA